MHPNEKKLHLSLRFGKVDRQTSARLHECIMNNSEDIESFQTAAIVLMIALPWSEWGESPVGRGKTTRVNVLQNHCEKHM